MLLRLVLLFSLVFPGFSQSMFPPSAGGGVGAQNVTCTVAGPATTLTCDVTSLGLTSIASAILQCWTFSTPTYTALASTFALTGTNPITAVTFTFSSSSAVTCRVNSNGGQGTVGPTGPAGINGTSQNAWYVTDLGTTNTLSGTTITTFPLAYAAGQVIIVKSNTTNIGVATININGIGAAAITRNAGAALVAGNLISGREYLIVYDGVEFEVLNPTVVVGDIPVAAAPTISSGFGTSPSVMANNGPSAFRIDVGTGGSATSGVIGLPTATIGWNCFATDITTNSTTVFSTKQTASSTTTATIGGFSDVAIASAWVASDILAVSCFPF